MSEDIRYFIPPIEQTPQLVMRADQLGETRDWGHSTLKLDEAQKKFKGKGIKVAVLDTGCDMLHPDLEGQIITSKDFTGSRRGPQDANGHGTHCSGIIAAREDGKGLVGASPDVKLLIGKVLGDEGWGMSTWIANGIRWAAENGANVISMSLGGSAPDPYTQQAIKEVVKSGVIVIAAAGNEGPRDNTVGYPGGYEESLTVAAIDKNLNVANFSSRGKQVKVSAPGVGINSTYLGGRYAVLSGTSMATPYVSGCISLYLQSVLESGNKLPDYLEIQNLIKTTSIDLGVAGWDKATGYGLVNPLKLISLPVQPEPTDPTPPQPISDSIEISTEELLKKGIKNIKFSFVA